MKQNWEFLEPFQKVLLSRVAFEPSPSPIAYSQIPHFGWITTILPEEVFGNAPTSWFSEWINKLHDGLRLFALAAALDTNAWRGILGLQGFPIEELNVQFRFRVGSRLDEIQRLLLRGTHDQTAYNQAKRQLLQRSPCPQWPVQPQKIPISLFIAPDHWKSGFVDELIEFWTLVKSSADDTSGFDDVEFQITELQLHWDEFDVLACAKDEVMQLLTSQLPISLLGLRISSSWSGFDVFSLVKAIDAAGVSSVKLHVASAEQYAGLIDALSGVQSTKSLEIGALNSDIASEGVSASAYNRKCSVKHLTWHKSGRIPRVLGGFESLELVCDHTTWRQTLTSSGGHLKVLSLCGATSSSLFAVDIAFIIGACPLLKALVLQGVVVDDLQALIRAYESKRCCITSLALRRVEIVDPQEMEQLAVALSDPLSMTSQCLVELVWVDPALQPTSKTLSIFSTMLDSNYRLRLLELHDTDAQKEKHHLRRLPAHMHSFIGVVAHEKKSQSAVRLLNRDILQQIFKYADVGERRRVILHNI